MQRYFWPNCGSIKCQRLTRLNQLSQTSNSSSTSFLNSIIQVRICLLFRLMFEREIPDSEPKLYYPLTLFTKPHLNVASLLWNIMGHFSKNAFDEWKLNCDLMYYIQSNNFTWTPSISPLQTLFSYFHFGRAFCYTSFKFQLLYLNTFIFSMFSTPASSVLWRPHIEPLRFLADLTLPFIELGREEVREGRVKQRIFLHKLFIDDLLLIYCWFFTISS